MTKYDRRPAFGTWKPLCEALDGRALLSVLGPTPENPPAEIAEPGELGPTLQLVATTPASGTTTTDAVSEIRIRFDRPLDEFSVGTNVRLDRLDDGSTVWDLMESIDPEDPSILVLSMGQALAPGSYQLSLVAGSFLSGLDGALLDTFSGDQLAAEFNVAEPEAESPHTDLGTLGDNVLTIPGTLDLAANPNANALYRVQISPAHNWWRIGAEVSTSEIGSSLQPLLSLYTEDGRLLRSSHSGRPGSPNDPYLFAGLPAGTYLIGVSGTLDGPSGYGLFTAFGGSTGPGSGAFALSLVAEPAETPTAVLGFQLDYADPNSNAPTGFALQFSGPMAPSDLSQDGKIGLEVVDAQGRVWPATAIGYDEATARLDVLLGHRLPAGSYTVRLAASGGLTDLAGRAPVRPGLAIGELARFLVQTPNAPADPLDFGALYPNDLASGGVSRSVTIEPGGTANLRMVVLSDGQLRFLFDSLATARLTPEAGGEALDVNDLATQPYLNPGVYTLTLSNPGGEAITTRISVEAHGLSSESLLLNGMGQGSALNLRLVAPTGGLSTALPVAATPGPSTSSQPSGANPAPWAGALLGLVPGPLGSPSSGEDTDTAPLTTTSSPQSTGGLSLGLSVEIVGAPASQPALVALVSPAGIGIGVGTGMGQGIAANSEVAGFPGATPLINAGNDSGVDQELALDVGGVEPQDRPQGAAHPEGDIDNNLTLARLDSAPEAPAGAGPDAAGTLLVENLGGDATEEGKEEEIVQVAAIDPCLALTAAAVVTIHFRDRIRRRLGQNPQRRHARPATTHWRLGFAPRVLQN